MPSCRSCMKDETVSTCVKSRNPLGVIVLVLLLVSAAFVYTAYYVYNTNSNKPTARPLPQGLSAFMGRLSMHHWCHNTTNINQDMSSANHTDITTTESLYKRSTACLQVVAVISAEHYPTYRNHSLYETSLSSSQLFRDYAVSVEDAYKVQLTYFIQHNLSTSTRHSTDVLIPTYVNISSSKPLPLYIREASTCQFSAGYSTASVSVSSCHASAAHFDIDDKWEHNIDVFVSVDEGRINIHLMYTSYFLLISAIFVIAYSTIRNRNSSKSSNKHKLPQKMHIIVY